MQSLKGMISVGPWGGRGGDHWSFKASLAITEIVITHIVNDNIHSISFKDAIGNISGTFGFRGPNVQAETKKVQIHWPSEYLMSISGNYGGQYGLLVIKSLSFITNLDTYGPFGTTSGDDTPFSIPIADGVVVGFHGRAGDLVDALGILVRPVDSRNGTISIGPWGGGGPGGDPFSFRAQGSWIEEIIVQHGGTINSIAFKDANGHYYGKFGGLDPNDTGEGKTVKINGPSEHLTSISGTYGKYKGLHVIGSLSFITNFSKYGPFGTDLGASFTIPIHRSHVIGFYGRAGYFLDSIGIIVKPSITN